MDGTNSIVINIPVSFTYGSMADSTNRSASYAGDNVEVNQGDQLMNHIRNFVVSNSERLREQCDFFNLTLSGMAALVLLTVTKSMVETITGEKAEFLEKAVHYSSIALIVGVLGYAAYALASPLSNRDSGDGEGSTSAPETSLYSSFPRYDSYYALQGTAGNGHEVV